jgi:hypothetical protein
MIVEFSLYTWARIFAEQSNFSIFGRFATPESSANAHPMPI